MAEDGEEGEGEESADAASSYPLGWLAGSPELAKSQTIDTGARSYPSHCCPG